MDAIPVTPPLVTGPVGIFLIVLVIILAAPIILNKLKIPHIIGLIVAGVAVGPYGFNILADDSSFRVFGQVGMLYLMFLAGLEIDMFHLKLNLRKGLLFGILTFIIPLVLGVVSSRYLLGTDWLTAALLGSMYASHTLLSYPVAARVGITKSTPVLVAVVGTIIAVTASLLVLAGVVTAQKEGEFNPSQSLILMLKLTGWCVAVIYLYPRITRYFFKLYHDKVTQYVYVLMLVFLAACTAQLLGLEAVLGAFIAGLVLNRYVPQASPLMTSIEFVGNALFIPYFLIGVGMIINIKVVTNPDTLAVAGIMLCVAIIGKWLPAWISGRINRFSTAGIGTLFGLSTAHTAVALAVVTIGYNLGMLNIVVLNATVLVILLTCGIAPIITAAYAPRLKMILMTRDSDTSGMAITKNERILIPVANPMTSQPLVELAILIRNPRATDDIYALHVRTASGARAKSISRSALEDAYKVAAAGDVEVETIERFDLNITAGVLAIIEERNISTVILGLHRRTQLLDSFYGNMLEQLLKSTNKMILISRCFIPINTIARVIVWVPAKAEFETGFSSWVTKMGRLAQQLGCRIIFCCNKNCSPLIRGILHANELNIRCEFRNIESQDDFILLSGHVNDDDLFAIVQARPKSISHSTYMVEIPTFLQKNFGRNNLLIIYPEQFGESTEITTFADPLSSDLATSVPSPWMVKVRSKWRKLINLKKRIRHPGRDNNNPLDL